jgi:hypothetical protein
MIGTETGGNADVNLGDQAFGLGCEAAEAGIAESALPAHCTDDRRFMHGYKTRLEEIHTKTILRAIFSHHPRASNLDPNSIQEVLECLDLDVQQALAAALKDPKPQLTDSEFADLVGDDEDDPEDLRDAADIEEDRKKGEEQD